MVRALKQPAPTVAPQVRQPAKKQTRQSTPAETPENLYLPGEAVVIVTGEPNFEILGPVAEVRESDIYLAEIPHREVDSTSFALPSGIRNRRFAGRANHDFKLPDGFVALKNHGYSEDGLPRRILCEQDSSEMVLVPAGVSVLGSDDGPEEARPALTVELGTFYIDVTETTLRQYTEFVESRRGSKSRRPNPPINVSDPDDYPALGVPWSAAVAFSNWVEKDLPTEAEWEKAGRSDLKFRYPWGNSRVVWPQARTPGDVTAVNSFRADRSRYGVVDLAGNAREWCLDPYSERAFKDAAESGPRILENWKRVGRPSLPHHRVVKGNGPDWSLWHRAGRASQASGSDVGFRCVLRVDLPEADEP